MHVTSRRAVIAQMAAFGALAALGRPARAGTVAPDAGTATRQIIFPVVGTVTYTDTFGACRAGCARTHEGIDIMGSRLQPLVAARDATVTGLKDSATPDGSQGNYVMLRDADGWEYWYIHVNNDSPGTDDGANPDEWIFGPGIEKGAKVTAGQHVGYLGDSGNAEGTAPHLHFEIHKPDGSVVNPYQSLQAATRLSQPRSWDSARSVEGDRAFARALSADFLDREASEREVDAIAGRLAAGVDRSVIVADFAASDEWMSTLIVGFYRSTLGREPDAGGLRYWIDQLRSGMTPAAVASRFYASDEYYNRSGGTAAGWVTDLYEEILGRAPDAGGLGHWTGKASAGLPRTTIATDFYGSVESRRTRVTALYERLLGRLPDPGGLAHWSERLSNGRDIELAVLLASSPEYYLKAAERS